MKDVCVSAVPLQCIVSPCGWTGVDVKFVLVLEGLKLVRVARDENIHIQLPLEKGEAGHVSPWDHLVPVDQTNLKLAHRNHLLFRVIQILWGEKNSDNASNNILEFL